MGRIWLGTSGFSYKEWRPAFYPADLPERSFLSYYSTRLNSVEIDSTFYRMPTARTIETWKNATGPEFRFAMKASQKITHWERLRTPSKALEYLLRIVPSLGSRLGLILYQLPPFFPRDLERLKAFLESLPRGIRSAFEFRHDSWRSPDVYDLLRARRAGLCIHDADEGTTPAEVTAPFVYLRLRRSGYDASRREVWTRRIRDWSASGLDVFAYVKHEDPPEAPRVAREFAEGLGVTLAGSGPDASRRVG